MFLGIDIGGTRIKAGVVDQTGVVLRADAAPTPGSFLEFRATVGGLASALTAGLPLEAVGIGCCGIIRSSDTMVECLPGNMDYLEGTPLSEVVAASIPGGTPVFADNDARAALSGEIMFGAARGKRNVLMLTLGTGVGGAILADGRAARGHADRAGHIGHLTVDPDGPFCFCGNRGCLETRFSARAIEIEAMAAIRRGCDSLLRARHESNPPSVTCEDVFRYAAEGDVVARSIIEQAVKYLGGALAGLLHVLDPEIVIVGGQIADAGEALFSPLREDISRRTRRLLGRAVPIVHAEVGDRSGVVGAASLAIRALQNSGARL